MATLLSLNVGMPKDVAWQDRTVHTGIFKYPVGGPRLVRKLNVDGDGQGDLGGHGGEIRAVLVYQRQSYDHWRAHLGRDDLEYGNFGENFTVDGLPDDEVCIGDRYRIGEAEFEVTQPRVTCFRVGMRLGEPRMPSLLVAHHRPGFYLRVIKEGRVQAGDEVVRTRVGRHALSVAAIDALLYLPGKDPELLRKALDIPELSPGWRGSFAELIEGKPGPAVGTEPGWPGFRPLRVSQVVPESTTIASIHLTDPDGRALPAAKPGQYLTLRVAEGVRNYSLSSSSEREYRISVKRDGVVSTYLHAELKAGASLDVAAPRGEFVLPDDDTGPVVLLSAGVGVTPVLAMLHKLAASATKREIWWLHTARSAAEQAFAAEAHELAVRLGAHEQVFHTADGRRIDRGTLAALELPLDARVYMCGPERFMTAMRDLLTDLGVADEQIHVELFGALPSINPGITGASTVEPHQPDGPPGTGPQVTFARSNLAVRWGPEYGSVLELAEACDVPTRWSCRTGVCHTCVTPVLSGSVSYQPDPLEPPEPGSALVCCSRPATEVVLDL